MRRGQRVRKPVTGIGPHAWIYYLLAVLLAPIAYLLLPDIQQDILNMLVGLSAVVATLLGARSQPTDHRLPFYLFAGGLLMTTVADFIYAVYEDVLLVEPFPSAADVFYVVNYPFYAVALLLLVWRRTPGTRLGRHHGCVHLDDGRGVLSWTFLMEPYANDLTLPILDRVLSLSYPLMDLLLLALAARLLVALGARTGVLPHRGESPAVPDL